MNIDCLSQNVIQNDVYIVKREKGCARNEMIYIQAQVKHKLGTKVQANNMHLRNRWIND